MSRQQRIDRDDAETIALQALAYLADDPQRLTRFLALSGTDAGQLRTQAKAPDFQVAILDYVMSDESLLLTFCQESGIDPMVVAPAHALLNGHW
jgi:hypothetical protein